MENGWIQPILTSSWPRKLGGAGVTAVMKFDAGRGHLAPPEVLEPRHFELPLSILTKSNVIASSPGNAQSRGSGGFFEWPRI